MARLNRYWRVAVVAACFGAMGIGGILYALVLFPALRLLPGGRKAQARRVRTVIHHSFVALLATLRLGGVMRLERRNVELLRDAVQADGRIQHRQAEGHRRGQLIGGQLVEHFDAARELAVARSENHAHGLAFWNARVGDVQSDAIEERQASP